MGEVMNVHWIWINITGLAYPWARPICEGTEKQIYDFYTEKVILFIRDVGKCWEVFGKCLRRVVDTYGTVQIQSTIMFNYGGEYCPPLDLLRLI